MICVDDDAGRRVEIAEAPRRIVSLVPSLTETLFALGCGQRVIGVTRYCTEPADDVALRAKVGGTKNPDCAALCRLEPDLVIVNAEENRREDFRHLETMGLRVFVTFPQTLDAAADLLRRLGVVTGCSERGAALATELRSAIADVRVNVGARCRVFCPIWKNPWMTIAAGTYVDDVLRTAGGDNIFRDRPGPYPTITLDESAAQQPEVVLLPDEPYRFSPRDLGDCAALDDTPAARAGRIHFVDGKALSWYGPRAAAGLRAIAALMH
ncbi:MAG TPA: helical backbone metal receptor [Candidatus Binatia bacterium]|nr:helical backbone metal receptor [Candidatus Binatia bacterium]